MEKSSANNVTKKQHFVPKFYLKNFANDKKFIEVLDIKNKKMLKSRPYSSVCYKDFFYGVRTGVEDKVSQQMEAALQQVESKISSELLCIIDKALNQKLGNDDLWILANLFSMLWMRTEAFRKHLSKMREDGIKQINKLRFSPGYADAAFERMEEATGKKMSEKEKQDMIKFIQNNEYTVEFSNAHHLEFMAREIQKFCNLFFNQKWTIYFPKKDGLYNFITSDNPVVEWFPKPKTFYGYTFLERTHCLALTPKIFVELTYSSKQTDWEPLKFLTYKTINETKVTTFNILTAAFSNEFAYSQSPTEIEKLLKEFRYQQKASINYIKKYMK